MMRNTLLAAVALLCASTVSQAAQHRNADGSSSDDVYLNLNGQLLGSTNPLPTGDANNAAFQGVVSMTVGTSYPAGRSLAANCGAAGNISLTFADASTLVVPAVVGFQTFPFAVTSINASGTTATCGYSNLK